MNDRKATKCKFIIPLFVLTQYVISALFRITNPKYTFLGDVNSRATMYRERLLLTQQRLLRSELFTLRGLKSQSNHHRGEVDEVSI